MLKMKKAKEIVPGDVYDGEIVTAVEVYKASGDIVLHRGRKVPLTFAKDTLLLVETKE